MMSHDVLNWKKQKVGEIKLDETVFGREVSQDLLHEVVRWQLSCRRQGTHMTKTKGLVSGGGKKPFKQKGTGGARQGSTRSILMPGGGTAFGPQPRSYAYALPKKVRKVALASALSYLAKEGRLWIVDKIDSDGKTANLFKQLNEFGLDKAFLVEKDLNEKVDRSARNLKKFKYSNLQGLNVYDILKYNNLIISKDSVEGIVARCVEGRSA